MKSKFELRSPTVLFVGIFLAIVIVVQILISTGILNNFWGTILRQGAVLAIVSIGLNLIYGFNGQFSLGQWGFYAIGAYAAADVTYRWTQQNSASGMVVLFFLVALMGLALWGVIKLLDRVHGLDALSAFVITLVAVVAAGAVAVFIGNLLTGPVTALLNALPAELAKQIVFFIAVLLAGGLAAEVSYIFGLPVLTLGSDYFGIATLGFTIIVKVLLDNSDTMFGFEEMKGARGMVGIPSMTSWLWVSLFLLAIVIITRNLLHSSSGRAIISVREDEIAAKAMGIDVAAQKTLTFVIGSLFAGLAGGLYAHINGFLHPNTFNFIKSFDPMIIIVFGGLGSITGTVLTSFVFYIVLEGALRIILPPGAELWRYVVYPLLLIIMMLVRPAGLFGNYELPFLRQRLPALSDKLLGKKKPETAPEGGDA
jgi:branched-chain amino acid transport system permease protein